MIFLVLLPTILLCFMLSFCYSFICLFLWHLWVIIWWNKDVNNLKLGLCLVCYYKSLYKSLGSSQLLKESYALIEVMQKKEPVRLQFIGQSHLSTPPYHTVVAFAKCGLLSTRTYRDLNTLPTYQVTRLSLRWFWKGKTRIWVHSVRHMLLWIITELPQWKGAQIKIGAYYIQFIALVH